MPTNAEVSQRIAEIRQRWLESKARDELKFEERRQRWAEADRRKQEEQAARDARFAAIVAHDRQLDEFASEAKRAEALVLESAGYHRHDRGVWRKKRRGASPVSQVSDQPPARQSDDENLSAYQAEVAAAQGDKWKAIAFFERAASQGASALDLALRMFGIDPVRKNEDALLDRMEPKDQLRRESLRRRLDDVRRDLTGLDRGSAIERVIIDRAVICWLSVQEAQASLLSHEKGNQVYYQKRLDHAQKRFLGVMKSLDQVRRKTPISHRLSVRVAGDLNIGATSPAPPTMPTIDLVNN